MNGSFRYFEDGRNNVAFLFGKIGLGASIVRVQFGSIISQIHLLFIKLKQRKSQPRRRFGYPVLISIDFNDFTSPFTP